MDRIGVFTHDFQILYLFETRETLEFVLNNSFEGSLYTRRRWWFCCYLYQWYNLWCKTLSNKQSAACYSRFHHTKTRNISKTPVGARWCNFKRLLGTISKLLSSHSKKNSPSKVGCVFTMVISTEFRMGHYWQNRPLSVIAGIPEREARRVSCNHGEWSIQQ